MKNHDFKKLAIVLGLIGMISLSFLIYQYIHVDQDSIKVAQLRFEIIKVVLVSVVLGLLGILIPSWFAAIRHESNMHLEERRHKSNLNLATKEFNLEKKKQDFETTREGRRLYSKVKTGLKYLPQRLAAMDYQKAMAHLEDIHQAYHLVILYPDPEDKSIGNYKNYFKDYRLYELRKALSLLMCNEEYQNSDTQNRIKLIDQKWDEISKKT